MIKKKHVSKLMPQVIHFYSSNQYEKLSRRDDVGVFLEITKFQSKRILKDLCVNIKGKCDLKSTKMQTFTHLGPKLSL